MDITALLEAFQDFEKREEKEPIPLLEQFLCRVAKTGQPLIPWAQFKPYFMFKLESIMENFNASAPEQRTIHHPNVEYVPYEEMKKRILKIVDNYNGIPFTIQRLCELLNDPKCNYTRAEKFLRGLEKNVMVVSCVGPSLEKHGASNANRKNGVMFTGNTLYPDCRNMNGPRTPKPLNKPKRSLSSLFSTNGLPESRESEPPTENAEDNISDTSSDTALSEMEPSPNLRTKNKYKEEEGEEQSLDQHEVKRLKFEKKEDNSGSEEKGPSFCKEPEGLSEASSEEIPSDTSCRTTAVSENKEPCNITTEVCENQNKSSEDKPPQSEMTDTTVDLEQDTHSKINTGSEQNSLKSCDSSDGQASVPFPSNSSDLTADGDGDSSNSLQTEMMPRS